MRKISLALLITVLICFIFTSCQVSEDYNRRGNQDINLGIYNSSYDVMDSGPLNGGTLKLFATKPDTLNPILTNNAYVKDYSGLIFESLIKLDRYQKPSPILCDRWEVSGDGLTWTFHLKKDVLWQDNVPFTADDVEFTFQTVLNGNFNSVYRTNLDNVSSFSVEDPYTFNIYLKKKNSFTAELITFPIIPKHYFAGNEILNPSKSMFPIGTGPYKFESIDEKCISLVANESWWNAEKKGSKGEKLPYIPDIKIMLYGSADEAIDAFQAREIDVADIDGIDYDRFTGRSDIILKEYTSRNFEFISFNSNKPVLSDAGLRQVFTYAIDRQKIINDVLGGKAVISDIPVIPGAWIYASGSNTCMSDMKKAAELLDGLGWKEANGRRYKNVNGKRAYLNFELLVNNDNELRIKVANEIGRQLGELGINLKVVPIAWDDVLKRINSGEFDMAFLGCRISPVIDVSFLYSSPYLISLSAQASLRGSNIAAYNNSNINSYINKIFEESDNDNKMAMFFNMSGLINDDAPYIGLYFYKNAVLFNERVKGSINPYVWDKYNDVTGWYLPEK